MRKNSELKIFIEFMLSDLLSTKMEKNIFEMKKTERKPARENTEFV